MAQLFSFAKQQVKAAIRTYYRMRNTWPMWLTINHTARSLHKKHEQTLDSVSQKIVLNLKKDGIAFTHIDDLFPGENRFMEFLSYAQKLEKNASIKTNKEFLQFYLDDKPMLDLKNPLVKFALEEKVLAIINSYMDMFSKFYMFTLNKTMPMYQETKEIQSQRWHRDPEDKKMVKVFMYFNDVDEEAGPFTYIKGSHFEGEYGKLFPPQPPRGSLPPPEEIKKVISEEKIKICTAPAGTVIFCDTRGIHKGGHATKKQRIMSTLYYSSRASSWPLRYHYHENFKETIDSINLSPAQRYALDNFYRIGKKVYKY